MIKLLKEFNKKDYFLIVLCFLFIAFQVWLDLKIPDYMSEITLLVKTEGSKLSEILKQGGNMLGCAALSLLFAVLVGYLTSFVSASFSKNIREKLFQKVQDFSMKEIKQFSISSLITRTTNDVMHVQRFISMGLQLMIKAPIMAIWAVIKILNKNMIWSMATLIAVLLLLFVVIILMRKVIPRFKLVQKLIDKINGIARENLTGIRVVRAFNAEKYQVNKFEKVNKELTDTQLYNQRIMALLSPWMYMIMNGLSLTIYFIGAILIQRASLYNKLTLFSDMVVFSSYAMQVIMSFLMLAFIFVMYPRASVSALRIREVLDQDVQIIDGKLKKNSKEVGSIEFKNVSFKYPDADEYMLKNISFKINKGETLAVIGSTGSGKSTIVNLIMRFYDATEGEILIDGINIKDYKLSSLYKKLGYVPQKPVMFSGSVNYNVSFGDNSNNKKNIKESIKVAQAKEFVSKMPDKYDSNISQGGTNISGGQKQRIAIARAINRKPEIYIFDDSFSALDYKTDYTLRKELKKYTSDATNIIVAQRIGTILNADKIMVLDEGKCVAINTHKELLKSCKIYQEIAYSQLAKEELESE